MKKIAIIGSGMMGSALAFPARENGHNVRVVGTHLDREIIDNCIKANRHLLLVSGHHSDYNRIDIL